MAHAETITVDNADDENPEGTDDGDCSLREAVEAANTNTPVDTCSAGTSGADTIVLASGETYTLSVPGTGEDLNDTGDLDVRETVTIQTLSGSATIDGGDVDRIIHTIPLPGQPALTMSNVTITNGTAPAGFAGGGILALAGPLSLTDVVVTGNVGGGISTITSGPVTLLRVTISDNEIAGHGGGISLSAGSSESSWTEVTVSGNTAGAGGGGVILSSALNLNSSTISGNEAGSERGGGIYNNGGSLTMTNSTISGNLSDNDAGGVHTSQDAVTNVRNSTITLNQANADSTGGGDGGGLLVEDEGTVMLHNSLLAENSVGTSGAASDCRGEISSGGYNLVQTTTTSFCDWNGSGGDVFGVGANLGPLTDNGGTTETHLPDAGSPAIDAGNPTTPDGTPPECETTDQRGVTRPEDGNGTGGTRCDIGAVERLSPKSLTVTPPTGPGSVTVTGIDCPGDCTESYAHDTVVTLTAAADPGESFTGWGGACASDLDNMCDVTMDQPRTVSATFSFADKYLEVSVSGPGAVSGPGVSCPTNCSEDYTHNTEVTLTATPEANTFFEGWGGDCSGTAATCQLTMDAAAAVNASFEAPGAKGVNLAASKKKVEKGKKVLLTAGILPCAGHEGDTINFFKGSNQVASVATNHGCVASTKVKMRRKATFTAVSPQQDGDHGAGTSPAVKVKVKKPR
ncbi:MAG: choice-of-anchor Q domain-containing protein [Actinomycetota bacterium]